jgi:nitric oxide reductase subunit C
MRHMATWHKRIVFASLLVVFLVYTASVYTAAPNVESAVTASERVRWGHQLFQDHNCIACHQFYGLGGYMGPDLTNVISSRGAGYTAAFLTSGTERMPDFGLTDEEVDALIGFLEFVDASGRYPDDYQIYWHGAVVEADD